MRPPRRPTCQQELQNARQAVGVICATGARFARPHAISILEVLVAVGIVALLAALLLASVSRTRASARSVECLSNLRQIGVGFQSYALDNLGRFPDPLAQATTWEAVLRSYLSSLKLLRCPADEEVYPTLGSSYDWRDGGDPGTSVAGRDIGGCRSDAVLAFDALPGWHRKKTMNVIRIDGSAHQMDEQRCLHDLRRSATRNELAR